MVLFWQLVGAAVVIWLLIGYLMTDLVYWEFEDSMWWDYPKLLLLPLVGTALFWRFVCEGHGVGLEDDDLKEALLDFLMEWAGVPEGDSEFEA